MVTPCATSEVRDSGPGRCCDRCWGGVIKPQKGGTLRGDQVLKCAGQLALVLANRVTAARGVGTRESERGTARGSLRGIERSPTRLFVGQERTPLLPRGLEPGPRARLTNRRKTRVPRTRPKRALAPCRDCPNRKQPPGDRPRTDVLRPPITVADDELSDRLHPLASGSCDHVDVLRSHLRGAEIEKLAVGSGPELPLRQCR